MHLSDPVIRSNQARHDLDHTFRRQHLFFARQEVTELRQSGISTFLRKVYAEPFYSGVPNQSTALLLQHSESFLFKGERHSRMMYVVATDDVCCCKNTFFIKHAPSSKRPRRTILLHTVPHCTTMLSRPCRPTPNHRSYSFTRNNAIITRSHHFLFTPRHQGR